MVKKVFTTHLVEEIQRRVKKHPFDPLQYGDFIFCDYTGHKIKAVLRKYSSKGKLIKDVNGLKFKTLLRSEAMNAMIADGIWSEELANSNGLERKDVVEHHSTKIHIGLMIQNDVGQEFRNHILNIAREAYRVEREKADVYIQGVTGGFLEDTGRRRPFREILAGGRYKRENVMPRLLIEKELYHSEDDHSELEVARDDLELLSKKRKGYNEIVYENWVPKLVRKKLSGSKWSKETKRLRGRIDKLQRVRKHLFSILLSDVAANRNLALIRSIGKRTLASYQLLPEPKALQISSKWQGSILLDEYRKWFNERYKEEIDRDKEITDRQKDKERKALGRAARRIKKQEKNQQVIDLWDEGEKNKAEIARKTNIAVRTARDIIKKHEQEKLEGEPNLSAQQLEDIAREEEEEMRVKERLLEVQVKQAIIDDAQQRLEKVKAFILKMHNEGKSPTVISENLVWSALKVNNHLKRIDLKPNFDHNFATIEEMDQHRIDSMIRLKETIKNRPEIDL